MSAAPKGLRQKMTTVSCCFAIRLVLCLLRFIAFAPLATGDVCTPRDEAFGYIVTELFFFVKLPLVLMVGGTIGAVTQHEGVGH